MELHVCLPNFGAARWEHVVEVAEAAEELGYQAVWSTDHLLVPPEVERYHRPYEALTVLAYIAARTTRVRLGTSVVVVTMRNPFVVAKTVATIDVASGGRVILGLGAGWNEEEFRNVHAEFGNRGRRLDEIVLLFRHLFSGSREPFGGEFYGYERGVFQPLPVQRERLPIMFGGNSDRALRRAARAGDIWQSTALGPVEWAERLGFLRAQPGGERVGAGARVNLGAGLEENLKLLCDWREAGAGHLALYLGQPEGYADRMRALMEGWQALG